MMGQTPLEPFENLRYNQQAQQHLFFYHTLMI